MSGVLSLLMLSDSSIVECSILFYKCRLVLGDVPFYFRNVKELAKSTYSQLEKKNYDV